ncbi:hypothetical protein FOMPIDRAFT_1024549 [Fomitopsis schrenkii]|uniref:MCM AAA-lid domain-containing protein n=1 Tax=Fomitopsis schrenkii TaxID=2126942 RepID=S8E1U3_FOMSC|nr:hypothetical protein FOMPIDRAFT_1024549 [Fomitopsis schrenkii]
MCLHLAGATSCNIVPQLAVRIASCDTAKASLGMHDELRGGGQPNSLAIETSIPRHHGSRRPLCASMRPLPACCGDTHKPNAAVRTCPRDGPPVKHAANGRMCLSKELLLCYVTMGKVGEDLQLNETQRRTTVSTRQLEGVIRLLEVHAWMQFSVFVKLDNMKEAYRLVREVLNTSMRDPTTGEMVLRR